MYEMLKAMLENAAAESEGRLKIRGFAIFRKLDNDEADNMAPVSILIGLVKDGEKCDIQVQHVTEQLALDAVEIDLERLW